jgi:hypothetical protein
MSNMMQVQISLISGRARGCAGQLTRGWRKLTPGGERPSSHWLCSAMALATGLYTAHTTAVRQVLAGLREHPTACAWCVQLVARTLFLQRRSSGVCIVFLSASRTARTRGGAALRKSACACAKTYGALCISATPSGQRREGGALHGEHASDLEESPCFGEKVACDQHPNLTSTQNQYCSLTLVCMH